MNKISLAILKAFNILKWNSARNSLLITLGKLTRFRKKSTLIPRTSYIDPSVRIVGINNVSIGEFTLLSENVWLNVNHRNGFEKKIQIGNYCHIGLSNYFSCGPSIIIKDYCFTGIDCQFLGAGHIISNPYIPYIASGLTLGAPIEIGVNCWLSTSVTIMQGVKVGYGSVIGARTVLLKDVPPFSLVVGNPGRVIKRFDHLSCCWISLDQWNENYELAIPSETEYHEKLNLKYKELPISLLASGKRFGWL